MRYYIIAGEASGDLHGSNLVRGLKSEDPDADIRCWGGDKMREAGADVVRHYKDGAVMGVTDVLVKAGKLLGNIRSCKDDIIQWGPDVVILIDYPGFNMKIAKFCHEKGIRVFYYIAPKTWASREKRNADIKKYVDEMFIVFPFEKEYFSSRGIKFTYKGNPLIDAVDNHVFEPVTQDKYVAILAGSRKAEISRMMPVCMEVAARYPQLKFIVAGAPARSAEDYDRFIQGHPNVKLVFDRTYDVLKGAQAAVINSGTASLEAALIGTPQVVCWSTTPFSFWFIDKILKVADHIKYISLGNLCIDKLAFKELIQKDFNTEAVSQELDRILCDEQYRGAMLSDYAAIRESLGGKGSSAAVAAAMIEKMKKQPNQ